MCGHRAVNLHHDCRARGAVMSAADDLNRALKVTGRPAHYLTDDTVRF